MPCFLSVKDKDTVLVEPANLRLQGINLVSPANRKYVVTALLVELAVTVLGGVSVMAYNVLFNTSIPPWLGMLAGAVNGVLVAWCIALSEPGSQDLSETTP